MDLLQNKSGPPHSVEACDLKKSVHQVRLVIPSSYVITGGHAARNSSTKAARAYAREMDNHDATPKKARKGDLMIFSEDDLINMVYPHKDALVISAAIIDFNVTRIMIDTGSATDILYYHTFLTMDLTDEMPEPAIYSLTGFTSDSICVKGGI
ncbi:hypothetical protein NE237_005991 [Protea cynaroides]|uniref:Uncharacterized protein n=1 Tax=Protea cynaroides TaxID=273540 RepID=A0A9Q0KLH4_9MAGN|nr:hypothetical protein NE237_005991 [Protea cynaroides]